MSIHYNATFNPGGNSSSKSTF
ncbi:hypothetical protein PT2222_140377 [Paraburkholderia tropica]